MKKTRLKPVSEKKLAERPARAACVAVVLERDGGCVFRRYLAKHGVTPAKIFAPAECGGGFEAHEPAKRSQGADSTNPDECICLCRTHHRWVHDHPAAATILGLLLQGKATTVVPGYPTGLEEGGDMQHTFSTTDGTEVVERGV